MYNDLVDIAAWRDFRENLRAISVSCCRHGRHSAGEWERETQSVYLISFPLFGMPGLCCFFRHVWPSASPTPSPFPCLRWHVMCMQMWQHICTYVAHILCDCHRVAERLRLRFKWEREACLFSCFIFLLLIEMRQRSDSRGGGRQWAGRGGVSRVVEVSYSFDCLPNCRISSASRSLSLSMPSASITNSVSHACVCVDVCVFKHSWRTQKNRRRRSRNDNNKFSARH